MARRPEALLYIALMASAGLCACATTSSAPSPSVALLSTAAGTEKACESLRLAGITCVFPGAAHPSSSLGGGSLPLSDAEYSFLDRPSRPAIRGFLILTRQRSPENNPYYRATANVFKVGFAGLPTPIETRQYDRPFWESVGHTIPISLPGSQQEQEFVAKMDAQAANDRRAAERRAAEMEARKSADAVSAAEDARRASPQYKKEKAEQAVEDCKRQIAWARAMIAKDNRIAQISGYENAHLRRQAATLIVNCEDTIARHGK